MDIIVVVAMWGVWPLAILIWARYFKKWSVRKTTFVSILTFFVQFIIGDSLISLVYYYMSDRYPNIEKYLFYVWFFAPMLFLMCSYTLYKRGKCK